MDSIKSIIVSRCDAEFTLKFPKRLNPNPFPQSAKLTSVFSRKELGDTSSLTQGSHISLTAPLFCALELSVVAFAVSSASNCSHHQQC